VSAPISHVRTIIKGASTGFEPYDFEAESDDEQHEELSVDELRRLRDVMEHELQTFDTRALVMKLQRMAVQP
jgi:hypothetical protein